MFEQILRSSDGYKINVRPRDTEDRDVTWVDLTHLSTLYRIRKFTGNFRTVSESIVKFIEVIQTTVNSLALYKLLRLLRRRVQSSITNLKRCILKRNPGISVGVPIVIITTHVAM